jgi:predicted ATP-grasp superfamily ATP-dependent carboligase
MGHAMLRHLQYRGMANVEFKRDVRDGLLKLIEINCRSGNRLGLAIDSGIDLPFIAYADLVGDQLPIEGPRDGLRWIDDASDLAAFRHYRRRHGLSLRDWLRSAWTAESHAFLSLDDPLPFASDLWHSTRSLWQRD